MGASQYQGRTGTVTYYEGQWNSSTFPVRIEFTGVSMLFTVDEVEELAAGAASSAITAVAEAIAAIAPDNPGSGQRRASAKTPALRRGAA
ncbi:hypothetical protein [Amycolatopsis minnesotensis]|uniref:hypothetical protein n=1 Tax=Amycolatopsis minnesotensis TaxID=337894 RepID=UPI0031E111BA